MNIQCPHCGSTEHYHRVSALSIAETSTINTSTKGVGVGLSGAGLGVGVGKANTSGTIETKLAIQLRQPEPPTLFLSGCGVFGVWILSFLAVGAGIICILSFKMEGGFLKLLSAVFLLILAGLFIVFRKSIAQIDVDSQANYEKEMAAWERRWYCKRCGEYSELLQ